MESMDWGTSHSFVFHMSFHSLTALLRPIQTIHRVLKTKHIQQSWHPEEHPEAGEDHTVEEDAALAAALGLIAHRQWHQVQGCSAWFVVTAVYGRISSAPAMLKCVSAAAPVPAWSQMADPQGHKIYSSGRKVDGILHAISLPATSQTGTCTLLRSSHKAEIPHAGCVE